MAFTFSTTTVGTGTLDAGYLVDDPVTGLLTLSALTDASSAAGTFFIGFKPRVIEIWDQTNANTYTWLDGMKNDYVFKHAAAGTLTVSTANGISVLAESTGTVGNGPWAVRVGTGVHTNSSTYRIMCQK